MSMGGGGSSGGQAIVQTGPTLAAAQGAAAAQINAANMAGNLAQDNTNKALKTLMNQYGTALQYAQPAINTGNQAEAQINYLLGMPAVAPGTAPTPVTMQSELDQLTPSQIRSYIDQNSQLVGSVDPDNNQPSYFWQYQGSGSDDQALIDQFANNWQTQVQGGYSGKGQSPQAYPGAITSTTPSVLAATQGVGQIDSGDASQVYFGTPSIHDAAANAVAKQNYQNDLPAYQQQLNAYNNQSNLYNRYNAKGQASASDISDIVTNMPGFQFQQQQGLSQIQNAASASGMLNSGALLQQLNEFGQGLSSTYFNNYIGQLGSLASAGNQASANASSGALSTGQASAGAYMSLGENLGNAALSSGQALASAYLSPLANQETRVTQVGGGGGGGGAGSIGGLLSGIGSILGAF